MAYIQHSTIRIRIEQILDGPIIFMIINNSMELRKIKIYKLRQTSNFYLANVMEWTGRPNDIGQIWQQDI